MPHEQDAPRTTVPLPTRSHLLMRSPALNLVRHGKSREQPTNRRLGVRVCATRSKPGEIEGLLALGSLTDRSASFGAERGSSARGNPARFSSTIITTKFAKEHRCCHPSLDDNSRDKITFLRDDPDRDCTDKSGCLSLRAATIPPCLRENRRARTNLCRPVPPPSLQ